MSGNILHSTAIAYAILAILVLIASRASAALAPDLDACPPSLDKLLITF